MYAAAREMKVREIMSRHVVSVTEEDTIESLLEKMLRTGHHRLPVVKGKMPVGIVARHDLLALLQRRPQAAVAE
jgi:CBS domain-containing protein